jgi:energy-coupling factor transporter ATP-binding protein EcfA2
MAHELLAESTTQGPPDMNKPQTSAVSEPAERPLPAAAGANEHKPRWLRDLLRFLPLKSQFVLSGNVQDLQAYEVQPGVFGTISLQAAIARELYAAGYGDVLSLDCVRGARVVSKTGTLQPANELLTRLGCGPDAASGTDLPSLGGILDQVVFAEGPPIALILDFAARLVIRSDSLTRDEHPFFSKAQVHSATAKARPVGPEGKPYFNTVVWIVDKEGDLPDWLLLGNPRIRHIPVAKPDNVARRSVVPYLLKTLPGAGDASRDGLHAAESDFVEETEGLLLSDLHAIAQLGRNENLSFDRVSDAVRRYKVGVTDDQWRKIDRGKIRNATQFISKRVRGQEHAVTHALDIIKRAITGVGASKRGGRPRGVAFLAGPTGVGKTELAKTITSLLFGDESAYIRFDMSEFSAEHADQRLIGAPPGYVGYDVGGELTNAVREKPFSVILFDEIEKAHPRILDKFLQILDDGVLTSGRGDRVYFSEAFIIFTSNLGIYRLDADGNRVPNVSQDESSDAVTIKVRAEIDRHFKAVLNRPEILNRIGENIIVFDFIRPAVAREIFGHMVNMTLKDLETSGIHVEIAERARKRLEDLCLADLSNGGRGIRNQVEAHLVNPLARSLFDRDAQSGSRWTVSGIEDGAVTTVVIDEH